MSNIDSSLPSLPVDVSQFTTIDKIYFDQVAQTWVYEDSNTDTELHFDTVAKQWIRQDTLANNNSTAQPDTENDNEGKRLHSTILDEKETMQQLRNKKKQKIKEIKQQEKEARQKAKKGTSVYVSNLPTDISREELEETFSKFGVLAEDAITGEKRVKLYKDAKTGENKGDALVLYHRSESVGLAIDMLDDTELRPESKQKIKVQKADFEKYGNNNNNNSNNNSSNKSDDNNNGKQRNSHTNSSATSTNDDKEGSAATSRESTTKPVWDEEKRKKISKVSKRLDDRINDWEETEDLKQEKRQKYLKRYEKTVILKHCFSVAEIEEDPEITDDIEQDMIEECGKFGQVLKVIVYDQEPEGIVLVKFAAKDAADLCVYSLNGRYFGGERLEAFIHDGKPYKKSKKAGEFDEIASEQRLKEYENFLQNV